MWSFLTVEVLVEHTDRVEHAQHGDAGICEHREPHGGVIGKAEHHDEQLYREREDDVLLGNDIGAACDIDRGRDGAEVGLHEHDIRRLDSCIGAAAHRRADVRARKYGSVIDAVTDEHDRAVLVADFAERAQLILRQQLRVHLVDADRLRHGVRACLTVAGQHGGRKALRLHAADGLLGVRLYRVRDVDMAEEAAAQRKKHLGAARRAVVAGKVDAVAVHELYVAAEQLFALERCLNALAGLFADVFDRPLRHTRPG